MTDFISLLVELSNRWDFCIAAALLGAFAAFNPWTKRWTSGLIIPMGGLLLRKILLFIPVCGALSTADRIIFWSGLAYVYFLILLLLRPLFYFLTKLEREIWWDYEMGPASGGVFFVLLPGLLIGSGIFLPVDGWSHAYMPVVCLIACIKIVLVSPALLPACWIGILLQTIGMLVFPGRAKQTINTILIAGVLIIALSMFIFQGVQMIPSSVKVDFEKPQIIFTDRAPQFIQDIRNEWRPKGDIPAFLAVWWDKLGNINRTGVNIIEKNIPDETTLSKDISDTPHLFSYLSRKYVAMVFVVTVLLLLSIGILSERKKFPQKQ